MAPISRPKLSLQMSHAEARGTRRNRDRRHFAIPALLRVSVSPCDNNGAWSGHPDFVVHELGRVPGS